MSVTQKYTKTIGKPWTKEELDQVAQFVSFLKLAKGETFEKIKDEEDVKKNFDVLKEALNKIPGSERSEMAIVRKIHKFTGEYKEIREAAKKARKDTKKPVAKDTQKPASKTQKKKKTSVKPAKPNWTPGEMCIINSSASDLIKRGIYVKDLKKTDENILKKLKDSLKDRSNLAILHKLRRAIVYIVHGGEDEVKKFNKTKREERKSGSRSASPSGVASRRMSREEEEKKERKILGEVFARAASSSRPSSATSTRSDAKSSAPGQQPSMYGQGSLRAAQEKPTMFQLRSLSRPPSR